MTMRRPLVSFLLVVFFVLLFVASVRGQDCPGDFPLQNHTGVGEVVCPCFIPGEEAGVILSAPAEHYPLEILKITVTWASQFGGAGQSLEQALHLYAGSLPDPGTPIFTLPGPVLTDGFANQFDIELIPGNKTIESGAFTVTLEFQNQNFGNVFAASVVHDGNGCQAGKNVVKADPGGWSDACVLGVTGDWVFSVEYRCDTATDAGPYTLTSSTGLLGITPNPFVQRSRVSYALRQTMQTTLRVFDVRGRVVKTLVDRRHGPGQHFVTWSGDDTRGEPMPSGIYFLRLDAGDDTWTRKVVLRR